MGMRLFLLVAALALGCESTGTVAAGFVARSPADGYTTLFSSLSLLVNAILSPDKIKYDRFKDFAPAEFLKKDYERWTRVIKAAGVKAEWRRAQLNRQGRRGPTITRIEPPSTPRETRSSHETSHPR